MHHPWRGLTPGSRRGDPHPACLGRTDLPSGPERESGRAPPRRPPAGTSVRGLRTQEPRGLPGRGGVQRGSVGQVRARGPRWGHCRGCRVDESRPRPMPSAQDWPGERDGSLSRGLLPGSARPPLLSRTAAAHFAQICPPGPRGDGPRTRWPLGCPSGAGPAGGGGCDLNTLSRPGPPCHAPRTPPRGPSARPPRPLVPRFPRTSRLAGASRWRGDRGRPGKKDRRTPPGPRGLWRKRAASPGAPPGAAPRTCNPLASGVSGARRAPEPQVREGNPARL